MDNCMGIPSKEWENAFPNWRIKPKLSKERRQELLDASADFGVDEKEWHIDCTEVCHYDAKPGDEVCKHGNIYWHCISCMC